MSLSHLQPEFAFGYDKSAADGLLSWRHRREQDLSALARRVGLPIGHAAEVWLKGGIRLHGQLRLHKDELFLSEEMPNELHLEIEGVTFCISELESCVRTD